MANRSPLPLPAQVTDLRKYVRSLGADVRRAQCDVDKHYLKRRITPFIQRLRYRRVDVARELLGIAEECLRDLEHAHALSLAAYFPGDQVTVEVVLAGHERPSTRNIVYDVLCGYEMWQLTKPGVLFAGGPRSISPSKRIEFRPCTDPLPQETERRAQAFRERAKRFIEQARDVGKLEEITARFQAFANRAL